MDTSYADCHYFTPSLTNSKTGGSIKHGQISCRMISTVCPLPPGPKSVSFNHGTCQRHGSIIGGNFAKVLADGNASISKIKRAGLHPEWGGSTIIHGDIGSFFFHRVGLKQIFQTGQLPRISNLASLVHLPKHGIPEMRKNKQHSLFFWRSESPEFNFNGIGLHLQNSTYSLLLCVFHGHW